MLYYVLASEFPLRPITNSKVYSTTVVTYAAESLITLTILLFFVLLAAF